jgi:hypothetical protein
LFKQTGPVLEPLWTVFSNIVCDTTVGTIYCVLDGLDECEEDSLGEMLERLRSLYDPEDDEDVPKALKMILVSREKHPECLAREHSTFPHLNLDLDPDSNGQISIDLQLFISHRVEKLAKDTRPPWPLSLRERIKKTLLERAGGTFLWVAMVVGTLRGKGSTEVVNAISAFPSDLNGVYAQLLRQVEESRRPVILTMIKWIITAIRPLTLEAMASIVELSRVEGQTVKDVAEEITSFCGSLLSISGDEIRLVHSSFREYLFLGSTKNEPGLEVYHADIGHDNADLAIRCQKCIEGVLSWGPTSAVLTSEPAKRALRDPSFVSQVLESIKYLHSKNRSNPNISVPNLDNGNPHEAVVLFTGEGKSDRSVPPLALVASEGRVQAELSLDSVEAKIALLNLPLFRYAASAWIDHLRLAPELSVKTGSTSPPLCYIHLTTGYVKTGCLSITPGSFAISFRIWETC